MTVEWLAQSMGPLAINSLFGSHSFSRGIFLSIDIVGMALVLSQSVMLDFVDFSWEAFPSLNYIVKTIINQRAGKRNE